MKRALVFLMSIILVPVLVLAQDVGSMAGTPVGGHLSLRFSYVNLSRKYDFNGFREKVSRDIFVGTVNYSFSPWANLYGFIGSSNFPNSIAGIKGQLYYGGGVKFMLLGGEVYVDGYTRRTIHVKAGIGLDIRVGHFQSRDGLTLDSFELTEYQGALDLGLKVFMVTSYCGFKLSWAHGDLTPLGAPNAPLTGRGRFSMFVGSNFDLTDFLALISEFSFFSEKSWTLGLRILI